jgi:hypothetical protein
MQFGGPGYHMNVLTIIFYRLAVSIIIREAWEKAVQRAKVHVHIQWH